MLFLFVEWVHRVHGEQRIRSVINVQNFVFFLRIVRRHLERAPAEAEQKRKRQHFRASIPGLHASTANEHHFTVVTFVLIGFAQSFNVS